MVDSPSERMPMVEDFDIVSKLNLERIPLPTAGATEDKECPICTNAYSEQHLPMRTPCQHLVCLHCITKWVLKKVDQQGWGQVTCAMCRHVLYSRTTPPSNPNSRLPPEPLELENLILQVQIAHARRRAQVLLSRVRQFRERTDGHALSPGDDILAQLSLLNNATVEREVNRLTDATIAQAQADYAERVARLQASEHRATN